jgi:hypothetical protein
VINLNTKNHRKLDDMTKKILCSDCGFLCGESDITYSTKELDKNQRTELFNGTATGNLSILERELVNQYRFTCYLKHWSFSNYGNATYNDVKLINQTRICRFFCRYESGYNPQEHKQLVNDKKTRNVTWNAALLGAGVGAAGAILAQLLYAIVTNQ